MEFFLIEYARIRRKEIDLEIMAIQAARRARPEGGGPAQLYGRVLAWLENSFCFLGKRRNLARRLGP